MAYTIHFDVMKHTLYRMKVPGATGQYEHNCQNRVVRQCRNMRHASIMFHAPPLPRTGQYRRNVLVLFSVLRMPQGSQSVFPRRSLVLSVRYKQFVYNTAVWWYHHQTAIKWRCQTSNTQTLASLLLAISFDIKVMDVCTHASFRYWMIPQLIKKVSFFWI